MVEDVADAERPERPGDEEDQIRRVAAVQDVDPLLAADAERQPGLVPERGAVFAQVAERAGALGRQVVAVDLDALEPLALGLVALALRADDRDRVAGGGERRRLGPDPAVEGHRQVLDDDQHPPPLPRHSPGLDVG